MTNFKPIWNRPIDELTTFDWGVLRLEEAMQKIREYANEVRMTPYMQQNWYLAHRHGYCRYLEGRLDEVGFGFGQLIIWKDHRFDEFDELRTACVNEAKFLFGPYLEQK